VPLTRPIQQTGCPFAIKLPGCLFLGLPQLASMNLATPTLTIDALGILVEGHLMSWLVSAWKVSI
jgi:hypothetical protein